VIGRWVLRCPQKVQHHVADIFIRQVLAIRGLQAPRFGMTQKKICSSPFCQIACIPLARIRAMFNFARSFTTLFVRRGQGSRLILNRIKAKIRIVVTYITNEVSNTTMASIPYIVSGALSAIICSLYMYLFKIAERLPKSVYSKWEWTASYCKYRQRRW
jgi:hypothetical protein